MGNLYEVDINVRNIKFIKGLVEAYDINGVIFIKILRNFRRMC